MFDAERAGAEYDYEELNWDHVHPSFLEVEDSRAEEIIQLIDDKVTLEVDLALKHLKQVLPKIGEKGGDPRIMAEAIDRLYAASLELDEFLNEKAISAYGRWDAHWFCFARMAMPPLLKVIISTYRHSQISNEDILNVWLSSPKTESENE